MHVEGTCITLRRGQPVWPIERLGGTGQRHRHVRSPGIPIADRQRRRHQGEPGPVAVAAELEAGHTDPEVQAQLACLWAAARLSERGQTEQRLGRGVRAVGDQPGGGLVTVEGEVMAIVGTHKLTVELRHRQPHPGGEDRGERGVGFLKRLVAHADRPDRPG